jgi:hypothetical protein
MKNLNQDSQSLGPRFEKRPPEYEAGVLTGTKKNNIKVENEFNEAFSA